MSSDFSPIALDSLLQRQVCPSGLRFHKTGSGPAMVLIHGVGLRAESWGPLIERFKGDFTLYALDIPGHGESRAIDSLMPRVKDYAKAIAAFLQQSVQAKATLVGHSLGALTALELGGQYPQFCEAIVAMSTLYERSDAALEAVARRAKQIKTAQPDALARGPVTRWFDPNDRDIQPLAELCTAMIKSNRREGYASAYGAFSRSRGASKDLVQNLEAPALFLTGGLDANSTPAMSQALAALSPRAFAATIKGAGHMAPLSHPEQTHAACQSFFTMMQR